MAIRWLLGASAATLILLAACSDGSSESARNGAENGEPEESSILYVGPEQVDCVGVGPQKCLLVRKSKQENWTYFYDVIHGFDYLPGYYWTLEVSYTDIENPPADASSIRVDLLRVVQQTLAANTTEDIEVSANFASCASFSGIAIDCLRIRSSGNVQWSNWSGGIEGYKHVPGIATQLRVNNISWGENAPQDDAPPFRRVLVSVLSSQSS